MNNFSTRTLTSVFFVVAMVGSVLLGQTVFTLLLLLVTLLSLDEFITIVSKDTIKPAYWQTVISGGLVYCVFAANAMGLVSPKVLLSVVPVIFLLFVFELWRNKSNPFINVALSLLAIIYLSLPLAMVGFLFDPSIPSGPMHYGIVLGYLLILWLNDTGAYLVGSMMGKHKLFERISPGKTWEGSMGGALLAVLTAWCLSLVFKQLSLSQWIITSLIIIVFGTLGDLIESMLKRSLGIKDSGKILPGHGGILDRFDAVLLSAPFVFVYLSLFCR